MTCPREQSKGATHAHLFNLCPKLEFLRAGHVLPRGPAPSSLRRLDMFSYDAAYDLPPHVQQTENLDDVTLDQEKHAPTSRGPLRSLSA